jgi:autoinducer 2 (AI-2) kinase
MGQHRILAIDLGTGSCRAILFSPAGQQIAVAQNEWSHQQPEGIPGGADFDTAGNWLSIADCIRRVLDESGTDPGDVAAVSATSMREGIVLYDADGRELWACPNVDSRATDEVVELVAAGEAERIYATAGDWVSITTPGRLLWIGAHAPEILAATRHLTMLSDWVLYRLSGAFVTDPSIGSSSGMFDLATRSWSPWIAERCGLPIECFPPVREPGTVVGSVTAAAAEQTGLRQGTPVVLGGADTQLALIGLGAAQPDTLTVIGGTFWQTAMVTDEPLIDPAIRLRTLCHAVPDEWMVEGISFLVGLAMRWFRDAFCQQEVEEAARTGTSAYALMEQLAHEVPAGSNGVIATFSNVMDAKRWVHASPSFLQFDINQPGRSGRKECIRALEEGAAYVVEAHRQILEEISNVRFRRLTMAGGAANGTLWPQIVADVTGLPVTVPVVKESSALGCALVAATGVGIHPSLQAARSLVGAVDRVCEPDAARSADYARYRDQWTAVYAGALGLVDEGLLRPLWRAAGT